MSKTVLIVDDSAALREIVAKALKPSGFTIIEAVDGLDALKKIQNQKIHLIISDLNMPNMDGLTFIQEAKKLPLCKFTPIIMLTTETSEDKKEQGQIAGIKAWMLKPFKPAQMLTVITKLLV